MSVVCCPKKSKLGVGQRNQEKGKKQPLSASAGEIQGDYRIGSFSVCEETETRRPKTIKERKRRRSRDQDEWALI